MMYVSKLRVTTRSNIRKIKAEKRHSSTDLQKSLSHKQASSAQSGV